MFFGEFKEFLHELFLKLVHGKGFAGAGLAISEAGGNALLGEDG